MSIVIEKEIIIIKEKNASLKDPLAKTNEQFNNLKQQ